MPNPDQDSWLAKLGVTKLLSRKHPDGDAASGVEAGPAAAAVHRGGTGIVDKVVNTVREVVGSGPSDEELDGLKEDLENGENAVNIAIASGVFAEEHVEKLKQAGEGLGAVSKGIGKVTAVRGDLRALLEIHDALKVLDDPKNLQPGSKAAAEAFGHLFHGAGTFVEKLPPPLNAYAPIFTGCLHFFTDMQRLLDPEQRPSGGEQMREVLREL